MSKHEGQIIRINCDKFAYKIYLTSKFKVLSNIEIFGALQFFNLLIQMNFVQNIFYYNRQLQPIRFCTYKICLNAKF